MAQKHNVSCIEHPMTVATTEQGPQKRYRRLRFPSFDSVVWSEKNPLLQKGELGHEKDTGRFKVGDGVTYWEDLPYNSVGDPAKVNGHNVLEIIAGKNVEIEQNGNVLTIGASGTGYSKQEVDNKFAVVNSSIDANADAIQKTRNDYEVADQEIRADMNEKDAELEHMITEHAEELTNLRGNQASLGDQVSNIESKIPQSASDTNPLITKQQLLDEEMDIRDDYNELVSELQTQITAQAGAIAGKQDKLTAGENITIEDGVISATGGGGELPENVLVNETSRNLAIAISTLKPPYWSEAHSADKSIVICANRRPGDSNPIMKELGVSITARAGGGGAGKEGVAINGHAGDYSVGIGNYYDDQGSYNIMLGCKNWGANSGTKYGIAIGNNTGVAVSNTIQFNVSGSSASNKDANTFKVANQNGNFEIMSADGTIPAERMSATAGTTGQVLTKTDAGMEWQDATGGGGASLPDQTGNAGKVLMTDGETASWQEPAGGTRVIFREWEE